MFDLEANCSSGEFRRFGMVQSESLACPGQMERLGNIEHLHLLIRDRAMLHAAWDDQKLTGFEHDLVISKLHSKAPLRYEEKLVFRFMVVPHERAHKFYELHLLPIEFSDDFRAPMLFEQREFF